MRLFTKHTRIELHRRNRPTQTQTSFLNPSATSAPREDQTRFQRRELSNPLPRNFLAGRLSRSAGCHGNWRNHFSACLALAQIFDIWAGDCATGHKVYRGTSCPLRSPSNIMMNTHTHRHVHTHKHRAVSAQNKVTFVWGKQLALFANT